MKRFVPLAALLCFALPAAHSQAPTPPMGWNSWDSYGTTINEASFRANTDYVASHLKSYGWQYVVIDAEWFVADPVAAGNSKTAKRIMDANGRYMPAPNRFPTAADGAGFAPLAAYVHSLGLKFGIHVLQGIPKDAVERNLPIAGSSFTAVDAANTAGSCPWNPDNYDVKPNAAGQAYYDSIVSEYASWNVDFLKVDCIASRPFKGDEIAMIHKAIVKTGRPMVLSLSPGEAPYDKVAFMQENAQMWRVSDDNWDLWHSTVPYPQGLGDQFPRAAKWISAETPGHWPDLDMLAIGRLGPAPGFGEARQSRLTPDEQQTLLTLWSVFRSPLMMGGDLKAIDAPTLALLTNPDVIELDQHSHGNKSVILTSDVAAWTALPAKGKATYVALFNLSAKPATLEYDWTQLGLAAGSYSTYNLWDKSTGKPMPKISVNLAPHASALMLVKREH